MDMLKYIKILRFMPMAEKDTFKLTKTARKPMNICWDCFRKTEQRHGFMTWTVWNCNVSIISTNLTRMRRRNILHI